MVANNAAGIDGRNLPVDTLHPTVKVGRNDESGCCGSLGRSRSGYRLMKRRSRMRSIACITLSSSSSNLGGLLLLCLRDFSIVDHKQYFWQVTKS